MKRILRTKILFVVASLLMLTTSTVYSHEGHDHLPGDEDETILSGNVALSQLAFDNLRIKVKEAEVRSIQNGLKVFGKVQADPARTSIVTSRISGRVKAVLAKQGEKVKKGQALIEIESRQFGNPPPKVTLHSEIDGIVLDSDIFVGDSVEPDNRLFSIADLSVIIVEGRLPESQVDLIKIGDQANVRAHNLTDAGYVGTVSRISPAIDSHTRSQSFWIDLPNSEPKLVVNMQVQIALTVGAQQSVIAVPNAAILGESGEYFVFIQSDNNPLEFNRMPVRLGERDDLYSEIIQGVLPEDKVVVQGNYQLQYVKQKEVGDEKEHDHNEGRQQNSDSSAVPPILYVILFTSLLVNLILLFRFRQSKSGTGI